MTKEEFIENTVDILQQCNNEGTEEGHMKADAVLCEVLIQLGYSEVVNEWFKVKKWYA